MGTTGRIDGLNVWRALLMLGGMATHATIMREDVAGLALIANLSHAFRMGAFFVISGLLTGFALLRRPRPELWLRDRLIQIGIPTVFGHRRRISPDRDLHTAVSGIGRIAGADPLRLVPSLVSSSRCSFTAWPGTPCRGASG